MFCSVTGYALGAGEKRFSQMAADSTAGGPAEPKPMEFSLVPSSTAKLMGASGSKGWALWLDLLLAEAAATVYLLLAGLLIATGLPGLPLPTSPTILSTGGQVAVAVGVLDGVYVFVGVIVGVGVKVRVGVLDIAGGVAVIQLGPEKLYF